MGRQHTQGGGTHLVNLLAIGCLAAASWRVVETRSGRWSLSTPYQVRHATRHTSVGEKHGSCSRVGISSPAETHQKPTRAVHSRMSANQTGKARGGGLGQINARRHPPASGNQKLPSRPCHQNCATVAHLVIHYGELHPLVHQIINCASLG